MPDFSINEHLSIDENSPYNIVSQSPLEIIEAFLTNRVKSIKQSENPRTIVLDTWLMLDYVIRELIVWGIGASSHSNEDFDFKSELLPIGFKNCVDFLMRFRERQINLPINPNEKCLKFPLAFWYHIHKLEDSNAKEIALKIIYDYQKKMNPNYLTPDEEKKLQIENIYSVNTFKVERIVYRTVSEQWLKVTANLTSKWFKDVEQINKARNAAAHSYKDESIYQCFGINGNKKMDKLRKKMH